jgi:hypothetical protein
MMSDKTSFKIDQRYFGEIACDDVRQDSMGRSGQSL